MLGAWSDLTPDDDVFFDGIPKDMVVSVAPPIHIRAANVNITKVRKEEWHGTLVDRSLPHSKRVSDSAVASEW